MMNQSDGDDHLMNNDHLTNDQQQTWRPMDGVGQLSDEYFVGNYMMDSCQSVGHVFSFIL